MSREFTVTLSCPFCDDAELTASFEIGYEVLDGPQMIDLTGCEHAVSHLDSELDPADTLRMDSAINAACEEAGRDAYDDAQESRYDAWKGRSKEC